VDPTYGADVVPNLGAFLASGSLATDEAAAHLDDSARESAAVRIEVISTVSPDCIGNRSPCAITDVPVAPYPITTPTNSAMAIFRIKTMDAVVGESLSDFTVYLSAMAVAAVLALVLASTGTYSVISHIATARTREFAIRVALGADRARVIRLIIGQGVRLTSIGLGVGLFGALAGGRLLQGLPVSVRPPDVVTAAPIAALIAAVAIVACLVPARRAAVKDPIAAPRSYLIS
jgi:hypothetical protein